MDVKLISKVCLVFCIFTTVFKTCVGGGLLVSNTDAPTTATEVLTTQTLPTTATDVLTTQTLNSTNRDSGGQSSQLTSGHVVIIGTSLCLSWFSLFLSS
uniref:Uncharacterized protein n=1 Tax=Magallana gigas TaxID=29159 RepID=A0A8W8NV34_MAGGI